MDNTETQDKTALNITLIACLYSSLQLHLVDMFDKYRYKNKLYLKNTLKALKVLDSKLKKLISLGTIDDFDDNVGEITYEFCKVLFIPELRAYYSYLLIKKLHKETNYGFYKTELNNIKETIEQIDFNINKFFENVIREQDKNMDLNIFEEKIVNLFKNN